MRARITLACAVATGLVALGCTVPAAAGAFSFGLSDYEPATFSDPRVAELGITIARDVVPWNVAAVPRDRAAVSAWLAAARAAHLTPLITFQHADGNDRAPTVAQYLAAFLRFRKLFGWVSEFCPWDEATHPGQPTQRAPRLAAAYYDALTSHCRGCVITAPDTLDADGDFSSWIATFLRAAHPYPRIWPFNPYESAETGNPSAVLALLSAVRGQIWFSEVGGIVWWRFHGKLIYHGLAYAARATANAFKLARLSPRITRIYYYHWRSPGNPGSAHNHATWDSGLVSAGGAARPALLVVAKALHRLL